MGGSKTKQAKQSAAWYKANKEAKLRASAEYRLTNKAKVAQYRLDYQDRRREKAEAKVKRAQVAASAADPYANLEGWPMCFHPPILGAAPEYTACATIWLNWQQAAADSPPGSSSFCTDCTPEYQSREIFHGRCRHPGTTFIGDPDEPGALRGVRPVEERLATYGINGGWHGKEESKTGTTIQAGYVDRDGRAGGEESGCWHPQS